MYCMVVCAKQRGPWRLNDTVSRMVISHLLCAIVVWCEKIFSSHASCCSHRLLTWTHIHESPESRVIHWALVPNRQSRAKRFRLCINNGLGPHRKLKMLRSQASKMEPTWSGVDKRRMVSVLSAVPLHMVASKQSDGSVSVNLAHACWWWNTITHGTSAIWTA